MAGSWCRFPIHSLATMANGPTRGVLSAKLFEVDQSKRANHGSALRAPRLHWPIGQCWTLISVIGEIIDV